MAEETELQIAEDDLKNIGVGKLLYLDNKELKAEISILKKSLKRTQDAFEKMRESFHKMELENGVMKYHISSSYIPEILKFLTSGLVGIFGGYYLSDRVKNASFLAPSIFCVIVYIALLLIYRYKTNNKG